MSSGGPGVETAHPSNRWRSLEHDLAHHHHSRSSPLLRFYTELFGAEEAERYPDDGPAFFVGLRIGDSHLGFVADLEVDTSAPQRPLLSIDVENVDKLLERVEALGGKVLGPANDMSCGQLVAHVQDPYGNPINLTQSL
jgi:predicted enzyme related to lactoylglutathione lyase